MASSSPNLDPTQLLRYVVQVDGLTSSERIGEAREQLTALGLLVDRIDQDEMEVAVSQGINPGADGIRDALESVGFSVGDITADPS